MKSILNKILTLLIITVLLATCFLFEKTLNRYRLEKKHRLELSEEVKHIKKGHTEIDWKKLRERNSDVIAWISIDDTEINYPVLKGEDNEYYLHRDIDKNYLYDGCIYVDAFNPAPFKSANTIVYGHKMRSGAMFADLKKYADKSFWKEHPIIDLYTPEKSYDLKVVAYTREDVNSDLYRAIDENATDKDFDNIKNFYFTKKDFIDLVKEKARILSDEGFSEKDTFVTLSTCVYSEGDERQQVICTIHDKQPNNPDVAIKDSGRVPTWFNEFLVAQIVVAVITLGLVAALLTAGRRAKKHT